MPEGEGLLGTLSNNLKVKRRTIIVLYQPNDRAGMVHVVVTREKITNKQKETHSKKLFNTGGASLDGHIL